MENNTVKRAYINDLLTLIDILDDYDEFNKNITDLINNSKDGIKFNLLSDISKGKIVLFNNKINKFYNDNKVVIDKINKGNNISSFAYNNYYNKNIEFFYKYFVDNKDKLSQIITLLSKIKSLGFNDVEFDSNLDFNNICYSLDNRRLNIFGKEFYYLNNFKILTTYSNKIDYVADGENNYVIKLELFESEIKDSHKKISVNNLLFDPNLLPDTLTKESTYDRIIDAYKDNERESRYLTNAVDLNIEIDNINNEIEKMNSIINNFDDGLAKSNLREQLITLKLTLAKLKGISDRYNSEIPYGFNITQETIEKEKKLELERRFWNKIDID